MQSEQINDLAAALAKAQGAMSNAILNKINPHFKSKYADLAAILDAVRGPLSANGISIMQTIKANGDGMYLVTTLAHTSGQWIRSEYPLPSTGRPQEIGSALTYARRYSLSAIAGIAADEDDDAEGAERSKQKIMAPMAKPVEIEAPVHPDTGEISPHKIEWNDNALEWGARYIAALKASTAASDLADWSTLNKDALEVIRKTAPKAAKSIEAARSMCLKKFTEQPAG